jgi:uncharacterized DUF497 family protein
MIDLSRILGFQWDAGNGRKSEDKHRVSQSEAEQVFLNDPLLLLADQRHSAAEARFHALGKTDSGRQLLIAFTLREDETLIRVISARDMNRRERSIYDTSA